MARAPDLPTLYEFEKAFEDAAGIFLASDTGLTVFASASNDDFVTPRLEIQFATGEAILPDDAPIVSVPGLTEGEYLKYDATFDATVISDGNLTTRAEHLEYVGMVRASLLRSASNWNSSNIPYYGLKFIRQISTVREVDGDLQSTQIAYEIKFAIRSDSFPTTTTTTTPAP